MTIPLPDPYIGGPFAEKFDLDDPERQAKQLEGRFDSLQRNLDALAKTFPLSPKDIVHGKAADWAPVAFSTNWRTLNNDAASYGVDVWRDHQGVVRTRGIAERINAPFTFPVNVLTYPVGFRPTKTLFFWVGAQDSKASKSMYRFTVAANGLATIDQSLATLAADGAAGSYIYLEQVSFTTF